MTSFNSPALVQHTDTYINTSNNNNDTEQFMSNLYFGETYYWRVRARNAVDTSAWSTVRIYLTRDDVSLNSPSNGTGNVSVAGVNLNWNSHWGVDFYEMELDTTFLFNSTQLVQVFENYINTSNNNNDTQENSGGLLANQIYYWRVRAINTVDTSVWTTWVFSTGPAVQVPNVPVLISPADGTIGTGTNVTLDWSNATNAQSYRYEYDTSPSFSSPTSGTVTASNSPALALNNSTVYYWRVRALNAGVTSGWSATWSFDTGCTLANPTISGTGVCEGDVVNLTGPSGTFNWYDAPMGGTLLATGNSYNYGVATATDTLYVSEIAGGCESGRTPVIITVFPLPVAPVIAGTGVCEGDQVNFTGPGGTYNWYDAPTGGTLLATGSSYNYGTATVTDTVYVSEVSGGCESARTPVAIEVFPLPAVPVITQVGTDSLTASGTGVVFQWFLNGSPLPQQGATIFVNQTGTYTAIAVSVQGCVSDSSAGFPYTFISTTPALEQSVKVWPNPTQGHFQLELPANADAYSLRLVNLQGQVVHSAEVISDGAPLDIQPQELAQGIYYLQIRTTEFNRTVRIVVQ